MKIKYAIFYAALAVAFAAVSAWVFLSGGRSAKAVRAKFRLGGLMLTVASFLATSCGGGSPQVTCYDTEVLCYDMPATDVVIYDLPEGSEGVLSPGDVLTVTVENTGLEHFSYKIEKVLDESEDTDTLLWQGVVENHVVPIGQTSYRGQIRVSIYGYDDEAQMFENCLDSREFTLK